ncbi:rhodanese-like domain-containing protein [Tuwongella immobilis]|uniref:Rhodanese domain-containing protein n=1 Tax=Tuwongella immobilis TaxID=692036 RepID=A0A6C2YIN0_9BACT|nr:rhodanese-like domain-containing protein [Tuwongella immobilis]VIP00935.1 Rhodanese domain protein OS=Pirellula staleyi (strain ATCC 27377 / DSM 6068 / ICPB 4128) GN=Psta_3157 PE=4 SV=1: Rhodanese [Tuwongella immobilis]VTR97288.1 Rhodanese domain protein OS=Pirellula staleyi (strain ATCC 27377 / DSM 6068 / ICPB 4128) GN=Psta_3157 PE=4 SV=1: Rhodanese [Tuwongella immobilis]
MMRLMLGMGLLALLGLATGIAPLTAAEHTKDSLETVKANLKSGKAVLVDVREPAEWEDGHIKDAKHLPSSQLRTQAKLLELTKQLPKDKILYLHCAFGARCLKVAELLEKQGFDARALKTGYDDLITAGFEVAK